MKYLCHEKPPSWCIQQNLSTIPDTSVLHMQYKINGHSRTSFNILKAERAFAALNTQPCLSHRSACSTEEHPQPRSCQVCHFQHTGSTYWQTCLMINPTSIFLGLCSVLSLGNEKCNNRTTHIHSKPKFSKHISTKKQKQRNEQAVFGNPLSVTHSVLGRQGFCTHCKQQVQWLSHSQTLVVPHFHECSMKRLLRTHSPHLLV